MTNSKDVEKLRSMLEEQYGKESIESCGYCDNGFYFYTYKIIPSLPNRIEAIFQRSNEREYSAFQVYTRELKKLFEQEKENRDAIIAYVRHLENHGTAPKGVLLETLYPLLSIQDPYTFREKELECSRIADPQIRAGVINYIDIHHYPKYTSPTFKISLR